jgi:Caspase domain
MGRVIVAPVDPTLDDMLAVFLLQRQLAGHGIPAGIKAFVEYAVAAREGLFPGTLPPEQALVCVYQAIRWKRPYLTDTLEGRLFLERWTELAERILTAAEEGRDPNSTPVFQPWQFVEEQAFLAGDRANYREDCLAGERWQVRLPDEGPTPPWRPALLLRRPRSCLWKFWSMLDAEAGSDRGYAFRAIDEAGTGTWIFSTHRRLSLSIRSLKERLQKEETERAPTRAEKDPWKAKYGDSFVSPPHGGTAIPEPELLALVKRWCSAKDLRPAPAPRWRPSRKLLILCAVSMVLTCCVGAVPFLFASRERVGVTVDGQPITRDVALLEAEDFSVGIEKLVVALEGNQTRNITLTPELKVSRPVGTRDGSPPPVEQVSVQVNEQPQRLLRVAQNSGLARMPAFLHEGPNKVSVRLTNQRDIPADLTVRVEWGINEDFKPKLYLLAIGVNHYQNDQAKELQHAINDAEGLVNAFLTQRGSGKDKCFAEIVMPKSANGQALIDPDKKTVWKCLTELKELTEEGGLAVITVAGHGEVRGDNSFAFLPSNFVAEPEAERMDTVVRWEDFNDQIAGMKCPVLVVMDTCCSGWIDKGVVQTADLTSARLGGVLGKGLKAHAAGTVVLTASRSKAMESTEWQHGALSLAVLECVRGDYLYRRSQGTVLPQRKAWKLAVSLKDLARYAEERVDELTHSQQHANVKATSEAVLYDVPLLRVPK